MSYSRNDKMDQHGRILCPRCGHFAVMSVQQTGSGGTMVNLNCHHCGASQNQFTPPEDPAPEIFSNPDASGLTPEA